MVLFFQLLSESFVVLSHFLFFELFPLQVNFLLEQLLSLLKGNLSLLFSHDITHEHLGVQSLDLILTVVEHLVGFVELLLSLGLSKCLFLSINLSSSNL